MSNRYLEKIALTRVVKELAKGTLGEYGSAKAMKSVHDLMQAGAIRSPKVYTQGMRVGNQEIAKKTGQFINKARPGTARGVLAQAGGGAASSTQQVRGKNTPIAIIPQGPQPGQSKHLMYSVEDSSLKPGQETNLSGAAGKVHNELSVRHEVIEGKYGAKRPLKQNSPETMEEIRRGLEEFSTPPRISSRMLAQNTHIPAELAKMYSPKVMVRGKVYPGQVVGSHHSPGVLGQESEVVRKNPYLSALPSRIVDHRRNQGEGDFLQHITGKTYGREKYTGKDIRKLERAKPDATSAHLTGTDEKHYHAPGLIDFSWAS